MSTAAALVAAALVVVHEWRQQERPVHPEFNAAFVGDRGANQYRARCEQVIEDQHMLGWRQGRGVVVETGVPFVRDADVTVERVHGGGAWRVTITPPGSIALDPVVVDDARVAWAWYESCARTHYRLNDGMKLFAEGQSDRGLRPGDELVVVSASERDGVVRWRLLERDGRAHELAPDDLVGATFNSSMPPPRWTDSPEWQLFKLAGQLEANNGATLPEGTPIAVEELIACGDDGRGGDTFSIAVYDEEERTFLRRIWATKDRMAVAIAAPVSSVACDFV